MSTNDDPKDTPPEVPVDLPAETVEIENLDGLEEHEITLSDGWVIAGTASK
jgi:hypothetical protein